MFHQYILILRYTGVYLKIEIVVIVSVVVVIVFVVVKYYNALKTQSQLKQNSVRIICV